MFNVLKRLFKKEDKQEVINNMEYDITGSDLKRVIFYNGELSQLDKNKKTIVFVDDYENMKSLFIDMITYLKYSHNLDLEKEYNIVFLLGDNCVKDCLLFTRTYEVDFAILDLTLRTFLIGKENGVSKLRHIDGIDLAREIRELRPECKIAFLTAHNLESSMDPHEPSENFKIQHDKYKKIFGDSLLDHYYNKLDDLKYEAILDLLKGDGK